MTTLVVDGEECPGGSAEREMERNARERTFCPVHPSTSTRRLREQYGQPQRLPGPTRQLRHTKRSVHRVLRANLNYVRPARTIRVTSPRLLCHLSAPTLRLYHPHHTPSQRTQTYSVASRASRVITESSRKHDNIFDTSHINIQRSQQRSVTALETAATEVQIATGALNTHIDAIKLKKESRAATAKATPSSQYTTAMAEDKKLYECKCAVLVAKAKHVTQLEVTTRCAEAAAKLGVPGVDKAYLGFVCAAGEMYLEGRKNGDYISRKDATRILGMTEEELAEFSKTFKGSD
ncbi:unnamed protein product [Zymoseptoria tritici ST99CH_3D7]|uniref:Uncharacterized protein n=1 Tax=Zymoseptoria tritici (strain ST99CH_3D7) TaxID=1276538 RepID=A0A1X7RDK8_ZYMT9|nr:unnamed protein product [Zymoseptoria tritici ST99CH_3D7]